MLEEPELTIGIHERGVQITSELPHSRMVLRMTPDKAREIALRLNQMADILDPPRKTPG